MNKLELHHTNVTDKHFDNTQDIRHLKRLKPHDLA